MTKEQSRWALVVEEQELKEKIVEEALRLIVMLDENNTSNLRPIRRVVRDYKIVRDRNNELRRRGI